VDSLIKLAEQDERIFALTAAMPCGTGLDEFSRRFPKRFLDCGIAESCTVDVGAGLAKAGLRPVAAIYSTFLQRAFDQVFQEVSLQGLPMMFCIDRAGLVGGDGAVHHGFLDIAFLRGLPGMVLMAPADESELFEALKLGFTLSGPAAVRYPRENVPQPLPDCPPFVPGVARRVRDGDAATILAYGTMVAAALEAAEMMASENIEVAVVNARFAKPIDRSMVAAAFGAGRPVVTVEDHSVQGGFGSAVLEVAQEQGLATGPMRRLGLPGDRYVAQGSRSGQLAEVGLDATGIASAVAELLGHGPMSLEGAQARRAVAGHDRAVATGSMSAARRRLQKTTNSSSLP
jgi:1-deoxy-D-xylulose-5-phosphate synthase